MGCCGLVGAWSLFLAWEPVNFLGCAKGLLLLMV
jgi:hypothetical protein